MAKQPRARHASTRNNVPNVENTRETQVSDGIGDGGRESSGTESPTSGNIGPESKTASYAELVAAVKSHNEAYRADLTSRAFHPEGKEGALITTNCADVPVLEGDASYQLSTGEIIHL